MLPDRIIDIHTHPVFPLDSVSGVVDFMDANNIEKLVALGSCGDEDLNDRILALRRIAPSRIVGGPYFDPRDPKAAGDLDRFHDAGCRIVKLFPNLGYYPDDPALLPFFEKAASMGFAFLSHCGWLGSKKISSTKYARPGRFEELFRRFPDTLFIMAHMGGMDGFLEGIMYTTRLANVCLDTTPGQSYWVFENAPDFVRSMPPAQLLMGTDGIQPVTKDWNSADQYPKIATAIEKLGWSDHLEAIFYSNAAALIDKYNLLP